jgi:hypothetical protein
MGGLVGSLQFGVICRPVQQIAQGQETHRRQVGL